LDGALAGVAVADYVNDHDHDHDHDHVHVHVHVHVNEGS
jgi:hypothetical protein